MGNIPITTPQVGPGLGVSNMPLQRTGGMAGRTLEAVATDAEAYLTKIAEQDAVFEGTAMLSKFRIEAEAAREKLQATATSPDGFTKVALDEFDTLSNNLLKNTTNTRAALFVQQRLGDLRADYATNSLRWETNARTQRRALMVEDTLNAMGAQVLKNPDAYDASLKQWDDAITSSGVPIDIADKMRRSGKDQLAVSLAQGMIRRNPFQALQALQSDERFTTLDPDKLESLIRSSESAMQHKAAMADMAANRARRARQDMGEAAAKQGFDLLASGKLSEEWMSANAPLLDTSDYRMLRQGMVDGGSPGSKDAIVSTFQKIYVEGLDASQDIMASFRRNELSASEAKSLLNENKDISQARQARLYLMSAMKPSDVNPNPAHQIASAEAKAEFERLFAENPKQDPMSLARLVLKRYAVVDPQSLSISRRLPSPKFLGDNNRASLLVPANVAATERNIAAFFMKKHGGDREKVKSDPDYRREMSVLREWKVDAERQASIRAAARDGE